MDLNVESATFTVHTHSEGDVEVTLDNDGYFSALRDWVHAHQFTIKNLVQS